MAERVRKDLNSIEIREIECQIVRRVLALAEGSEEQAASLLNWPIEYLEKVKQRCQIGRHRNGQ